MHHRPYQKKNCHSREGGNPRIYGGERKVQLIMFTYLDIGRCPTLRFMISSLWSQCLSWGMLWFSIIVGWVLILGLILAKK